MNKKQMIRISIFLILLVSFSSGCEYLFDNGFFANLTTVDVLPWSLNIFRL
ncbi:hypothetical protein J2T18_000038 [Paenibacillus polymyxa]|nr:hypothetical protein [Paenibacillus polymyxa]